MSDNTQGHDRVIKLYERYPESRREDVTDAFMRGFESGLSIRGECHPEGYVSYDGCEHDVGEHEEFWEPACKCSACGSLIPMRAYCPDCGRRLVKT